MRDNILHKHHQGDFLHLEADGSARSEQLYHLVDQGGDATIMPLPAFGMAVSNGSSTNCAAQVLR